MAKNLEASLLRLASAKLPPLSLASMHRFAASVRRGSMHRGIPAQEALQLSHRFLVEQVPVRAARMAVATNDAITGAQGGLREGLERMHQRYGRLTGCDERERSCAVAFQAWFK